MTRELTYAQAINEAFHEEMARDPTIIALGEDITGGGPRGVTAGLLAKFGSARVLDTPISEGGFIGAAVGMAMTGLRPVAELRFMDFLWVAADPIFNQAAKMRYKSAGHTCVPMVLRTLQGTSRGLGATHSQSLEAICAHIPGLKVVMPATPHDAKGLFKTAVRDVDPVLFIEHKRGAYRKGPVPEEPYLVPFGQAAIRRAGSQLTVVSWSNTLMYAVEAAEQLAADGYDLEVIDLRTLVPLDLEAILTSVRKTRRLLIAHEAHRRGGFGAEIAATVQEQLFGQLAQPVVRVGALDVPVPYSQALENIVLPETPHIVKAVKEMLAR